MGDIENNSKLTEISPEVKVRLNRVAKIMVLHCVRNTFLEDLHAGTAPSSKAGDYSDVKVVTPYGEIPWNNLSRLDDYEMKRLMKEVVNKVFTFLAILHTNESLPVGALGWNEPNNWDDASFDESFLAVMNLLRDDPRDVD